MQIKTFLEQQHRSCIDQIRTLKIITEQPIECNSSYDNFIDFKHACQQEQLVAAQDKIQWRRHLWPMLQR